MAKAIIKSVVDRILEFSPLLYLLTLAIAITIGAGIFASNNTSKRTDPPPKDNYIPALKTNFDKCEIGSFWISVSGWALLDLPDNTIKVHLFANGPNGTIKLLTRRLYRKDVSDFMKINSEYHLHGFHASAIRYKLRENFGTDVTVFIEDSKGVMHYGGEHVCTAQ